MENPEKLKFITKKILNREEPWVVDLFNDFDWKFEKHGMSQYFPNLFNVTIFVLPDKFVQYSNFTIKAEKIILMIIRNCSSISIEQLTIKPNYELIEIHNSQIEVIMTEWQEINQLQKKLISSLNQSVDSIDYQNIGNTSRTIMEKLSDSIFKPAVHFSEDNSMDLSKGKFKNKLQCYVRIELLGKNKKPLRKLAQSAINYTMDAIDLMNSTTHKLNAEKYFAESCVTSTINVIALIKSISEMNREHYPH